MKRFAALLIVLACAAVAWLLVSTRKPAVPVTAAATATIEESAPDPAQDPGMTPEPAAAGTAAPQSSRLAGRPVFGGGRVMPRFGPPPGASGEPGARPNAIGVIPTEMPKGPPPRLEIVVPPADATEMTDRTARLAAEAYGNVVKAMKLDPDQEEKFKQILYDSRQSYEASLAMAKKSWDAERLDSTARAMAEAEARKKAWDDQKVAAEEQLKELMGERQMGVYRAVVQNPLFLANGLHFKVNPEVPSTM